MGVQVTDNTDHISGGLNYSTSFHGIYIALGQKRPENRSHFTGLKFIRHSEVLAVARSDYSLLELDVIEVTLQWRLQLQ